VQRGAVASQKYTWPVVTGLPAIVTLAVNVITLPEVTVVTTLSADVTASVVVVALVAQAVAVTTHNSTEQARKVIVGATIRPKVVFMPENMRLQDAGDESIGRCSPKQNGSSLSSAALGQENPADREGTKKGNRGGEQ
jgi:hypothetical protein